MIAKLKAWAWSKMFRQATRAMSRAPKIRF